MSLVSSTAKITSNTGFYDYPIEQSLRFDGSSYLSRTPTTAGDSKVFTLSFWIKKTTNGVTQNIGLSSSTSTNTGGSRNVMKFESDDTFQIGYNPSGSNWLMFTTKQVFRDTSSWMHIVAATDTNNSTSTERVKIYINGAIILQSDYGTYSTISGNTTINTTNTHALFAYANTLAIDPPTSDFMNDFMGYAANIHFIDGQALTPTSFGETKSGVWTPKAYTGSYGTNGFRLAFNLSDFNTSGSAVSDPYGSATNLPDGYVADASGSGNHWQVN